MSLETTKNLIESDKQYFIDLFPPSQQAEVEEKLMELTEALVNSAYNIGWHDCNNGVPMAD